MNKLRQFKIKSQPEPDFFLSDVPAEYAFIEAIAKRHARSKTELEKFYTRGVLAAKTFRLQTDKYEENVAWMVEQSIKAFKKES